MALIIAPTLAAAQANVPAAQRYQACTRLAAEDATTALDVASRWRDEGGGVAAQHCIALALSALERFEEAARMLETALEHIRAGRGVNAMGMTINRDLVARLHAQAGHAWLLAERPINAYQAFSAAIAELPPRDPATLDYAIDRARASAASGDYDAAVADLDEALLQAPERGEIYLFRATARRHLGAIEPALQDANDAVRLLGSAEAYLERGNLRMLAGDEAAARADWQAATNADAKGPAGQAARQNLQRLEDMLAQENAP
ncbi:MAG: hypothetical protein Tsb0016_00850 [Sphingomonadales bacterium]